MPLYRGSRRLILMRRGSPPTTFDPLKKGTNIVLSNGNLTATSTSSFPSVLSIASHSSGLFYCETHIDVQIPNIGIGNASTNLNSYIGFDNNSVGANSGGQVFLNNVVIASLGALFTTGNTLCLAVNLTNQIIWYRANGGLWNNSGTDNPATNTGGVSFATMATGPYFAAATCNVSDVQTANFGATAYAQTAPSGFVNW